MPQLDKLTYFSQFFWLCLLLFTFYILFFNNNNGILGISRILKLRNQLLSHRGNKIRSKDPKNLEDISRKGFSTGLSYINSCLSEVSQWCKTVDYFRKRRKITLIPNFGEISGSRGMERQILHLISKSSYNTSSSRITCRKNIMLTHESAATRADPASPPKSEATVPLSPRDEAPGSPYSEPCVNNEDAVSDDPNSVQAIIEQDEVSDDPNSVQAIIEQDEVSDDPNSINNEVKDKGEVGTSEGPPESKKPKREESDSDSGGESGDDGGDPSGTPGLTLLDLFK
ncbi:hypothetical protein PVAP13_J683728 [Panicum virgatum]|nr:hypothetical protein PVAP13_J683728 [Panicum virgatum]